MVVCPPCPQWEEALRSQSGTYTEAGFSAAKRAADCRQMSMATARQNGVWKAAAVKTAASLVGRGWGPDTQLRRAATLCLLGFSADTLAIYGGRQGAGEVRPWGSGSATGRSQARTG